MYCRAARSAPCAAPTEQLAMLMRPPSSPCIAILKPSPTRPSRCSAGMRNCSKPMLRVGWLFQPTFPSFFPYLIPGVAAPAGAAEQVLGRDAQLLQANAARGLAVPAQLALFLAVADAGGVGGHGK